MSRMTKAQLLQQARDVGRVLIDALVQGEVRTSRPKVGDTVEQQEAKDATYRTLVAASLVASICDGFTATLAVLRSRGQGHVFAILRSMNEALADLILLGKDPSYIQRIGYVGMQKLTALKELRRAGITGGLDAKRKFERAGMGQEYRTVYSLHPGFGHHAPGTLGYRHLAADRSHLHLGKRLDHDTLHASDQFACQTLLRAVDELQHHGTVDESLARSAVNHAMQKVEVIERASQLSRAT